MNIMPTIVERIGGSEKYYDIPSRLFQDRIVMLVDEVNEDTSTSVISQLLYLDSESNEDITLLIKSPGGSVYDGLAIIDTMDRVKSNVNTVATGCVASMGSAILACGKQRKASKYSRIMIHSLSAGTRGSFYDMKVDYEEFQFLQELLIDMFHERTGQTKEKIREDWQRDKWMSADDALYYGSKGIVDMVI